MNFNLKIIAAAAAIASMAGTVQAQAVVPTPASTGNGSLLVVAFNTVTRAFYIRNTGFTINSFLPSGITTRAGDGGVTGSLTPDTGLTLDASNTPTFADAAFGTWLDGQTTSDVRWLVTAADATSSSSQQSQRRVITSSANDALAPTNGQLDNYTLSGAAGNVGGLTGAFGLSVSFDAGAPVVFDTVFGLTADGSALATLDQEVGLHYFVRERFTGGTTVAATPTRFGNANGFATVSLASNGDFTYNVPTAPIPLPPALWMMGAGLVAVLGAVRRRKAVAAA